VTDELRRKVEQLEEALESRTVIGQALGMLMERYGITKDEAFAFLARCSQHENRKLHDIATQLVETRELPRTLVEPGPEADRPEEDMAAG
jgi:AmiR/NasT family two-component response regulator